MSRQQRATEPRKQRRLETVVICKCVGCGATQEVRAGEDPVCEKDYMPMYALRAETRTPRADIAQALAEAREEGRREGAESAESRARQAEAEVARLLVAARDVLSGRPGCIFVLAQAVADTKGQP